MGQCWPPGGRLVFLTLIVVKLILTLALACVVWWNRRNKLPGTWPLRGALSACMLASVACDLLSDLAVWPGVCLWSSLHDSTGERTLGLVLIIFSQFLMCPPALRSLIDACWSKEPHNRPTMEAVHDAVAAIPKIDRRSGMLSSPLP